MSRTLSLALTLTLACWLGSSPAHATWQQHQGNAAHDGYTPARLSPTQFRAAWQRQFGAGGTQLTPATIGLGQLYVSAAGYFGTQTLLALDVKTGDTRWSHDFNDIYSLNPPSFDNGLVFVQTGNHANDTYLRAYDAVTGELRYRTPHSAQWERYLAPTVFDKTVYVNGGGYGGMYAFGKKTGALRWFAPLQQYDQWTPAVDATQAYAYVGGTFSAQDRHSGQPVFSVQDPGFIWSGWSMGNTSVVLDGQSDAYVINSGRLMQFDLAQRRIGWSRADDYTGQPAVAHGVLYAVSRSGTMLKALNPANGKLLWSWALNTGTLNSNLVVTDTHLFVGTSSTTYAIDLQQRQSVWQTPVGGSLALGANRLFIVGTDTVTAIALGR